MTTPAPLNPGRSAADERRPDWFDSMRAWWDGAEAPPPEEPRPAADPRGLSKPAPPKSR